MARRAPQNEKLVNIPRSVQDEFYRYTMPQLRAKVEGRGNGVKTVIENMAEIAKALDRRPDYPTKFFGFELGALTKVTDKYVVNGRHDAEGLAKVLDLFIEKYVLCSSCRNPETNMIIKGDNIGLVCRACGATTQVDPTHKLSTYILKYPPTAERRAKSAVSNKQQRRDRVKARGAGESPAGTSKTSMEDEDEEDWCADTSKEAVEARRRETLGLNDKLAADEEELEKNGDTEQPAGSADGLDIRAGQSPIPAFQAFWQTNPSPSQIVSKMKAVQASQNWSDSQLIKMIFGSLFDKNIRKNFYDKARTLQLFVPTVKEQKTVMLCIEKLCEIAPTILDYLASVLNGFYEAEVLDEELLIKWYKHPSNRFDPKLSRKIRDASQVFIEWLQTAELESSEEDF